MPADVVSKMRETLLTIQEYRKHARAIDMLNFAVMRDEQIANIFEETLAYERRIHQLVGEVQLLKEVRN